MSSTISKKSFLYGTLSGVVEALIPKMSEEAHSTVGVAVFAVGFPLMMALDVAPEEKRKRLAARSKKSCA